MPDPEKPPATAPPATPAPPAAEPPAAVPPVEPAVPAAQPPGELDPGQYVSFTGSDENKPELHTLGELVDRWRSTSEVDEKAQEIGQLVEKAMKTNDPAVLGQLYEKLGIVVPVQPAAGAATPGQPAAAPDARVEALQTEVTELRNQMSSRVVPVVDQISQMQQAAAVKGIIAQHADKLPHLAQYPGAAEAVMARMNQMREVANAANIDLDNHPERVKIMANCCIEAERAMQQNAKFWREDFKPPTGQAAAPAPGPMDDQAAASGATPGVIPAAVAMINGVPVDTRGHPVAQVPGGEVRTTIPAQIPEIAPTGTAVGVGQVQQPTGPMTYDKMVAEMKVRRQQFKTEP